MPPNISLGTWRPAVVLMGAKLKSLCFVFASAASDGVCCCGTCGMISSSSKLQNRLQSQCCDMLAGGPSHFSLMCLLDIACCRRAAKTGVPSPSMACPTLPTHHDLVT